MCKWLRSEFPLKFLTCNVIMIYVTICITRHKRLVKIEFVCLEIQDVDNIRFARLFQQFCWWVLSHSLSVVLWLKPQINANLSDLVANCGFSFRFPVKIGDDITKVFRFRAFARSGNPGVPVLFGEHNIPSLVEIGLTDLPKSGDAMATPESPGTTGLRLL